MAAASRSTDRVAPIICAVRPCGCRRGSPSFGSTLRRGADAAMRSIELDVTTRAASSPWRSKKRRATRNHRGLRSESHRASTARRNRMLQGLTLQARIERCRSPGDANSRGQSGCGFGRLVAVRTPRQPRREKSTKHVGKVIATRGRKETYPLQEGLVARSRWVKYLRSAGATTSFFFAAAFFAVPSSGLCVAFIIDILQTFKFATSVEIAA